MLRRGSSAATGCSPPHSLLSRAPTAILSARDFARLTETAPRPPAMLSPQRADARRSYSAGLRPIKDRRAVLWCLSFATAAKDGPENHSPKTAPATEEPLPMPTLPT